MKIIDRYIMRQFLLNVVILFMVLSLMFVLVDLIVNLDEFIEAGQIREDQYGGVFIATLLSVFDFYGPLVILMYVYCAGLITVGAMGFTLSGYHRNRELIAVVASGISMYRLASPILVAGIVLSALTLPCQEYLVPRLAPKLMRGQHEVKYETIQSFPIKFASDEQGNLFSAADFEAEKGRLESVTILQRDQNGIGHRRITADQADWVEDKHGWKLWQGYAVSSAMPVETGLDGATLQGEPEPVEFVTTELSPTVLLSKRASNYPSFLPMSQLQAMQQNPAVDIQQRRQITQVIWSRFSLLVLNVLVLVMGLPFFLLRSPANLLLQGIKAAGICLGAWGGGLVMLQVSTEMLPPVVAAWLPVVIYLPVSAFLMLLVET